MSELTGLPAMLEPDAGEICYKNKMSVDTSIQLSIAVSLRRIADVLERVTVDDVLHQRRG